MELKLLEGNHMTKTYSFFELNNMPKNSLRDIYFSMIDMHTVSRSRISHIHDINKEDLICLILGRQELKKSQDRREYLAEACNAFLNRKEYNLEDNRITDKICEEYESDYDNCYDKYGYDYSWDSELTDNYVKRIIEGERLDP